MLSNFTTLLLGLGSFLQPSHKHARTRTLILEPSCATDRWRINELVHLERPVLQEVWVGLQRTMDKTSEINFISTRRSGNISPLSNHFFCSRGSDRQGPCLRLLLLGYPLMVVEGSACPCPGLYAPGGATRGKPVPGEGPQKA